jgi:hypothetical protein
MTTESQEAFEAAYPHYDHRLGVDGKYHSRVSQDAYTYFTKGVAYGRKQALKDVANSFIKQKSWTQDMAHAVVQHAADEGALK